MERHKTHKNAIVEPLGEEKSTDDSLKKLLDGGVRIALQRPWHRIERGLRLGRLRQFIDDVAPQYHMTDKDKESFFTFLQKSLDNKLLNTIKVVDYDQETERIRTIKGLEIKRNQEENLRWAFSSKTVKKEAGTRKKKKPEPSVSTIIESPETKIEEKMEQ